MPELFPVLLREQIQVLDDQPIEVSPSDHLPDTTVIEDDVMNVPIPAVDGPALTDPSSGARKEGRAKAVKQVAYTTPSNVQSTWTPLASPPNETYRAPTSTTTELPKPANRSSLFSRILPKFKKADASDQK